jgi:UDP-N-acetylglucosamine/UDP-N-acetylgalactosamine diphosphorylase
VGLSLRQLGIDPQSFDLIIADPSPTDWVRWQRGKVTPRLSWDPKHDNLWEKFNLPNGLIYIGVQAVIETTYGSWRNWPLNHLKQLLDRLESFPHVRVILFGADEQTKFPHKNLIDLRGKTTLFEMLSIIRHRCHHMILPDSGVLSMVYYLDLQFPIHVISFWGDPNHGILKQAVASPNLQLVHHPLVGELRDLSSVSVDTVMNLLFPVKPLRQCPLAEFKTEDLGKTGCIILAGGQGSRLGMQGPKGTFSIHGKSLFEWICEKTPKKDFPIAIMTSLDNHEETVRFFTMHANFDREIYFFQQECHSLLDEKKRPLDMLGPNGNGSVFRSFVASGLGSLFSRKGIEFLSIVPIENPLADPLDAALIDYARSTLSDVVIKCVEREVQNESMGAIVEREGRMEIVEYIHLDPKEEYKYSNTGMMAISFPFFLKMGEVDLPIHLVKKKTLSKWVWKGEKFIFDVLPFGKVSALCYPKKSCYAPLKTSDSVKAVEQILACR